MVERGQTVALTVSLAVVVFGVYMSWRQRRARKALRLLTRKELSDAHWRPVGRVCNLWMYPVKSCAPIPLSHARAHVTGFKLNDHGGRDRSFLIVNANDPRGWMVTGRKFSNTVLIQPSLAPDGGVILCYPGKDNCKVQLPENVGAKSCKVWNDVLRGVDCGDEVAVWLSSIFGSPVRLLYHNDSHSRRKAVVKEQPEPLPLLKPDVDGSLYADMASYMLASAVSVEKLRQKSLNRDRPTALHFRPNILIDSINPVTNLQPYEEDDWTYVRIGEGAVFRNIKPSTRCYFTCVDPITGVKDPDNEVMKILRRERIKRGWAAPIFGINLGLEIPGVIRDGDTVYVLDKPT